MYKNLKKIILSVFLVVSLVMLGNSDVANAGEKNPCGKNPCAVKNPCAKNPCASMKNPCAANNPIPIRKDRVKDHAELLQLGEKLWNDTKLGTSGLACATCHPEGKNLKGEMDSTGMTAKGPFPKYLKMPNDVLTRDQMINFCMLNPMKGKPLSWNSVKMTALSAYIQAYAKEEGKPVNPCAKNPCSMKNPCGKK